MSEISNVHIVAKRNKDAAIKSTRAAAKRRNGAAAGLLRIDGEIVVATEAAATFGVPANRLRAAVSHGINTTPLIRAWAATGRYPGEYAANRLGRE